MDGSLIAGPAVILRNCSGQESQAKGHNQAGMIRVLVGY